MQMSSPDHLIAPAGLTLPRLWNKGAIAALAWLVSAAITRYWPNGARDWPYSQLWAEINVTIGLLLLLLTVTYRHWVTALPRLRVAAAWLIALPLLLSGWQLLTAKLLVLPVLFFAPPQALLQVFHDDWPRLLDSLYHSLSLLVSGVLLGTLFGFIAGLAIGWSPRVGYWMHPVLRILGPLPATALLPLCFFCSLPAMMPACF